MDYSAAGWMLSILQFVSLPFSFIIPVLAGRNPNQRMLVTISALSMLTGYAGLFSGLTSLNLLWVMLVGISGGANFSLSLMFFTLRTKSAQEAPLYPVWPSRWVIYWCSRSVAHRFPA